MLDRLEDPDRIFIGGSGGESGALLREAQHRLKPGGRIVMTIVTMDTLETARSFLQQHHFQITVTQLQVNRSVPIGKTHRLEALNPVFIMAAWKETEPSDG
jgi:precorrin-6B methylase 2